MRQVLGAFRKARWARPSTYRCVGPFAQLLQLLEGIWVPFIHVEGRCLLAPEIANADGRVGAVSEREKEGGEVGGAQAHRRRPAGVFGIPKDGSCSGQARGNLQIRLASSESTASRVWVLVSRGERMAEGRTRRKRRWRGGHQLFLAARGGAGIGE